MKVLSFRELKPAKGIPYSRVHLRRLEADGNFPGRVQLGGNAVAWIESEIDAWLEERAADRDADRDAERVAAEAKDKEAHEASAAEDDDEDEEEDEVA